MLTNVELSAFLDHLASFGVTVLQGTASSLRWWLETFNIEAGFDLRSSMVRAEVKVPLKQSGHTAEQARPFELSHMEQSSRYVCMPQDLFIKVWRAGLQIWHTLVYEARTLNGMFRIRGLRRMTRSAVFPVSRTARCHKHAVGSSTHWGAQCRPGPPCLGALVQDRSPAWHR